MELSPIHAFLTQVLSIVKSPNTPLHCLLSDDATLSATKSLIQSTPEAVVDIPSPTMAPAMMQLLQEAAEEIPPTVQIRPYDGSTADFLRTVDILLPAYDLIWTTADEATIPLLHTVLPMDEPQYTLLCLQGEQHGQAFSECQCHYRVASIPLPNATILLVLKPVAFRSAEQDKAIVAEIQRIHSHIFGADKEFFMERLKRACDDKEQRTVRIPRGEALSLDEELEFGRRVLADNLTIRQQRLSVQDVLRRGWIIETRHQLLGQKIKAIARHVNCKAKKPNSSAAISNPRKLVQLILGPDGLHKLRFLRDTNLLQELLQPDNYRYVKEHADREWWSEPESYRAACVQQEDNMNRLVEWPTSGWIIGTEQKFTE